MVCDDLADGESRFGKKRKGFDEEQCHMLEKWQVPKKYHEMIEDMSYTKDEGYFIYALVRYVFEVPGISPIAVKHCRDSLINVCKSFIIATSDNECINCFIIRVRVIPIFFHKKLMNYALIPLFQDNNKVGISSVRGLRREPLVYSTARELFHVRNRKLHRRIYKCQHGAV